MPSVAQAGATLLRVAYALLFVAAVSLPAAAQTRRTASSSDTPAVSVRGFFLATGEQFAAERTFDAVFGARSMRPFWGGGAQVVFRNGLFAEVSGSRFMHTGQRAFVIDNQVIPLGIPLTVTITPIEIAGGYRFRVSKLIYSYGAVGITRYAYTETSQFNEPGEDEDVAGTGFVVMGGAEVRLHRWFGVAVDAQYTQVKGILGDAGISKAFGEKDLGGAALRVKILVGR